MIKNLLAGFTFGVVLAGCQSIPIIDKMDAPMPRVERFYSELQEAKEHRAAYPLIEAQPNYVPKLRSTLPELP